MRYLPEGIEFPVIITFHEKHGDYAWLATDAHQFYATFQEVFECREDEGWYFDDKFERLDAKTIFLSLQDDFPVAKLYELPYIWINHRRDLGEYEGFDLVIPEQAEVPSVRPDRYELEIMDR
jgi:hypothetical protein